MKSLEEIVIPLGLLASKFLVVKKASFNCTVATLAGVSIAKILDLSIAECLTNAITSFFVRIFTYFKN